MFSARFKDLLASLASLAQTTPRALNSLRPLVADDFIPYLWAQEFGSGGALDSAIHTRAQHLKRAASGGDVYAVVPIYVTSICSEQCLYCNYRAANKGIGVERRRLSDDELAQEVNFLIEQKGYRTLELVYASDPLMRADAICRHVELTQRLLDQHGGGIVGLSAESLDESEYRSLVGAGLNFSVMWQETYDPVRYAELHPGHTKKHSIEYRLDAYERMFAAGLKNVGVGVLSGLSDWRRDWAMLMLHQEYLQQTCGRVANILGIPRLKSAPGALMDTTPFVPSRNEFLASIALHEIFSPGTRPWASTREDWDTCVEIARGGGCLFTFNCSTIPGGYSLHAQGGQFATHSFDAPEFAPRLREYGIEPLFRWHFVEEAAPIVE
jgi:2-iminoacetate synthase